MVDSKNQVLQQMGKHNKYYPKPFVHERNAMLFGATFFFSFFQRRRLAVSRCISADTRYIATKYPWALLSLELDWSTRQLNDRIIRDAIKHNKMILKRISIFFDMG